MGILLIFLSVCSNLAEGMIVKLHGQKGENNSFSFNALMALASMLFFVITQAGGFSFPAELWLYAVPSAICYCSALICTYFALRIGSFAISMMVISYSVVLPIVYGVVFLSEPATAFKLTAFAIMAASLYLSRGDTKDENRKFSLKWLIYILTAAVGSGFFAVVKKMQQLRFLEKCNNEFMILSLGLSVIALFVISIVTEGGIKSVKPRTLLVAVGAGFSNGITNMLTLLINTMVALSISSPISTGMRIVFSFMISSIFLREKFLKRQILGVCLGAAALIMLSF